jgi:hypothetical protein
VSGYTQTLSAPVAVIIPNGAIQTLVTNCPTGTRVFSGYILQDVSGVFRPIPLPVTSYASGSGQWTFLVHNLTSTVFQAELRHGAVCAAAN